jgi:hypothetical protein
MLAAGSSGVYRQQRCRLCAVNAGRTQSAGAIGLAEAQANTYSRLVDP